MAPLPLLSHFYGLAGDACNSSRTFKVNKLQRLMRETMLRKKTITQMLEKNTFKFLKDLKLNNLKEWLDGNKKTYKNAKSDILTLTAELITSLSEIDTTILNAHLDPKKCITRLNRDLRFAKDKTPYKTDYYIVLNKNGKNSASAFYYLHIEPGNCFVGGGLYNPQPDELKKLDKK